MYLNVKRNLNGTLQEPETEPSKELWNENLKKQCLLVNLQGESGAHEAPYVALFIWSMQPALGESVGATHTAAPLEIE